MTTNALRTAFGGALIFLLGERCAGCNSALATMCDACLATFQPIAAPRTPRGLEVVSALEYAGAVACGIRALKGGRTELARVFAPAVAAAVMAADRAGSLALVPVPTSARSYRQRGYRVPEALLRAAGVPAYAALAARGRAADQRELTAGERAANAAGSMRMRYGCDTPKRALIFDDVYTTGATLDEAARVLRERGCAVLGAVTLAHTKRNPAPESRLRDRAK